MVINMQSQRVISETPEETFALGGKVLITALETAEKDKPLVFWLEGELGAGKTYFTKGIAHALGITGISSPTFVLMKKFKISRRSDECAVKDKIYFFHIDCYRIYDEEDARQIGLDKIISNPCAIIAIEWAERIKEIIPKPYWKMEFKYEGESGRKINITRIE